VTIVGVVVFVIGWIYAVLTYGFFLGLGVCWFPALVIALIADRFAVVVFGLTVLSFTQLRARQFERGKIAARRPRPQSIVGGNSDRFGFLITCGIIALLLLGALAS
jgi:hypothetical protein